MDPGSNSMPSNFACTHGSNPPARQTRPGLAELRVWGFPVKRHRGEPGHTRDTRDTRAHAGTRITRTNLTTIHPTPSGHKPARKPHGSHGRTSQPSTQTQRHKPARKPRPTQQPQEQPQARSRVPVPVPVPVQYRNPVPVTGKKTPGKAGTHTGTGTGYSTGYRTGKKTPGGARWGSRDTHGTRTGQTGAHGHTDQGSHQDHTDVPVPVP